MTFLPARLLARLPARLPACLHARPGGAAALEKKHNGEASAELVLNMKVNSKRSSLALRRCMISVPNAPPLTPIGRPARSLFDMKMLKVPELDWLVLSSQEANMGVKQGRSGGGEEGAGITVYTKKKLMASLTEIDSRYQTNIYFGDASGSFSYLKLHLRKH